MESASLKNEVQTLESELDAERSAVAALRERDAARTKEMGAMQRRYAEATRDAESRASEAESRATIAEERACEATQRALASEHALSDERSKECEERLPQRFATVGMLLRSVHTLLALFNAVVEGATPDMDLLSWMLLMHPSDQKRPKCLQRAILWMLSMRRRYASRMPDPRSQISMPSRWAAAYALFSDCFVNKCLLSLF